MILKNRRGQSAIEMIMIIAVLVLPPAVLVNLEFKKYMKSYGDSLKNNLSAQIRYGVHFTDKTTNGVNAGSLDKKEAAALPYALGDTQGKHPFKYVTVGW